MVTLFSVASGSAIASAALTACDKRSSPDDASNVLAASLPPAIATSPSIAPAVLLPDEQLLPDETRHVELGTHCGVGFLSQKIDGRWWRTDEAEGLDWMPQEWPKAANGLVVEARLSADETRLTVSYGGRSVLYYPTQLTDADLCA